MPRLTDEHKFNIYPIISHKEAQHLQVIPVCCGHELQTSTDYRLHGRKHVHQYQYAFVQYTISGEGALELGGKKYRLRAGDAMLLEVPEDHLYYLPEDSPRWELLFLEFVGSEAFRLFRCLRNLRGPVLRLDPEREALAKAWHLYQLAGEGRLADLHLASSLAYDFLVSLCAEATQNEASAAAPEFVARVHAYCARNIERKISVDDMAKAAGYSRYHFCRLFHKCHGMSPMDFVLNLKLKTAKHLLERDRLGVKEVAQRCGFGNTSYFCKVFRKAHGLSPGEYCKLGGGGNRR